MDYFISQLVILSTGYLFGYIDAHRRSSWRINDDHCFSQSPDFPRKFMCILFDSHVIFQRWKFTYNCTLWHNDQRIYYRLDTDFAILLRIQMVLCPTWCLNLFHNDVLGDNWSILGHLFSPSLARMEQDQSRPNLVHNSRYPLACSRNSLFGFF